MAAFNEPDLLEEDFPIETKQVTLLSEDREELDNQATSLQTKLAELNRAREKLEREKATVEESRRRFSEFETGREEMMHEITRSLGLLEDAQMDAQREAEQMARTMDDLRDAFSKIETLEDVDTHDEQWKVLLTRNLTTIENARMEINSARLKWPLLDAETRETSTPLAATSNTNRIDMAMPKSFGELCLWGLALTWPILLVGAVIIAILLGKE
jgi:chromosome segregation ATPase